MGRFLASTSYRKRRLTVPTVSLMGGADAGVRPGMLDVYGGLADDLAGHIIDGAAHFLADDRPDAVVTHGADIVRPCPLTDPRADRPPKRPQLVGFARRASLDRERPPVLSCRRDHWINGPFGSGGRQSIGRRATA
jgi:hypothetical protein